MAIGAYNVHKNFDDQGIWLTVLIGVFGVLCGWILGVLSSPLDKNETQAFGKFAGVISGFLSGYLLMKIDKIITDVGAQLLTPVVGMRVLIFISCLISGVLIMYILRAYLHRQK